MSRLGEIWRKYCPIFLIVCFIAGLATGRFSRPAEVHEKVAEHSLALDASKDAKKAEEHAAADSSKAADTIKSTKTTFRRDGSIASKVEVEEAKTTEASHTETSKVTIEVKERIVYQEREKLVERTVLAYKAPTWIVGLDAGTSLPGVTGHKTAGWALPYAGVVGVSVDRRLFGSFYLGAWGNTQGALGLRLVKTF